MKQDETPSQDDGFNSITRAYKANPTIENYVALRRQHPNETIQVAMTGGLDWLFGNEERLNQLGLDPQLVGDALDADPTAVSELSLRLLELIIERKKLEGAGKTHIVSRGLAISDHTVNYLINVMLGALDWNDDLFLSRDLIVLILHQIGGATSDWERSEELKKQRTNAVIAAAKLAAGGESPSIRGVAKSLGVSQTTVMRWFPRGDLAKILREIAAVTQKQ